MNSIQYDSNGTDTHNISNYNYRGLIPDRPGSSFDSPSTIKIILIPIGVLFFIATAIMLIVFFVRRTRMERLRHRLMPLYSYDPDEDNADWEAELIEDEREQQRALTANDFNPKPGTEPRLSFLRSPPEA